jgi:hypothetical protein
LERIAFDPFDAERAGEIRPFFIFIRVQSANIFLLEPTPAAMSASLGDERFASYAGYPESTGQVDFVVDHLADLEAPGQLAATEYVGDWQYRPTGVDGAEHHQANAGGLPM